MPPPLPIHGAAQHIGSMQPDLLAQIGSYASVVMLVASASVAILLFVERIASFKEKP
jgi:hypothetical protein